MANVFTAGGDLLPSQAALTAGSVLKAEQQRRIHASLNRFHAVGPCSPMLSQEWAQGQCSWNDALVEDVSVWRLPQPSPAHTSLRIMARASTSEEESGSFARFRMGASTWDATPAGPSLEWLKWFVEFPYTADGYRDLRLDLSAAAFGDIELRSVTAWFDPLTSPLPAGPAGGVTGGFVPFGEESAGDDRSQPSARGHQKRNEVETLTGYPRQVLCWSALRGIQSWANAADAASRMPPHPHRVPMLVTPGVLAAGDEYTVWVRVLADEADDTVVPIYAAPTLGSGAWGMPSTTIIVPANPDPDPLDRIVWIESSIRVPEVRWMRDLPWYSAGVGIYPGIGQGRATAEVLSASIWGP